jgi:lipid-binding SYLF domain-containing protein
MTTSTRRALILSGLGAAGAFALGACSNNTPRRPRPSGAEAIDARVDATLDYLFTTYPDTVALRDRAVGMLVMPVVTKAGLFLGGAYGKGALRVGGVTDGYWAASSASFGLQIGAQQYSHVLFFMTDAALEAFRAADSITLGADIEYAVADEGGNFGGDTVTMGVPVVALVFGQAGIMAGVSMKGTLYTRINP